MSLDGIKKSLQGLTTLDEVLRVAPPEDSAFSKAPMGECPGPSELGPEVRSMERPIPSLGRIEPYKILVVDDNKIIRAALRKILEKENHRVITAEDGLEAIKLVMAEQPDLIITDLLMPKMDGMTLIKKLRSHRAGRHVPIIMLTAKDEVDFEVKGIDAGADDYLVKPVNPKRLLVRINRLLRRTDPKR
jgi:PleD family two-component response regulator